MRRVLVVAAALALAVGLAAAIFRGHGISAVQRRSIPFEPTVVRAAWRFLVPRRVRDTVNPVPDSSVTLKAAREHWADHCAICHDNDGSGDTAVGRRTYPRPPDLRLPATQRLTDGEIFYAIEQGVPWTATPGWTTGTDEGADESWALVRFVRHLPAITPAELEEMARLNPKPPANTEQEKEIEDFLRGK